MHRRTLKMHYISRYDGQETGQLVTAGLLSGQATGPLYQNPARPVRNGAGTLAIRRIMTQNAIAIDV